MKARYSDCLGPNGAGKSTTLEIMETLRTKTSGEVHVAGFNLDKDAGGNQEDHRSSVTGVRVFIRA
jgi:ABC-type multidrug transport system ATPase subunit